MKEILKVYRIKYGYSQSKLASKLNVNQTAISNYESGKQTPSVDVLIRYCEIFNLSLDYLCNTKHNSKLDELCIFLNSHSDHEIKLMLDFLEVYIQKISKHIM